MSVTRYDGDLIVAGFPDYNYYRGAAAVFNCSGIPHGGGCILTQIISPNDTNPYDGFGQYLAYIVYLEFSGIDTLAVSKIKNDSIFYTPYVYNFLCNGPDGGYVCDPIAAATISGPINTPLRGLALTRDNQMITGYPDTNSGYGIVHRFICESLPLCGGVLPIEYYVQNMVGFGNHIAADLRPVDGVALVAVDALFPGNPPTFDPSHRMSICTFLSSSKSQTRNKK
jgi:hypothetical protein